MHAGQTETSKSKCTFLAGFLTNASQTQALQAQRNLLPSRPAEIVDSKSLLYTNIAASERGFKLQFLEGAAWNKHEITLFIANTTAGLCLLILSRAERDSPWQRALHFWYVFLNGSSVLRCGATWTAVVLMEPVSNFSCCCKWKLSGPNVPRGQERTEGTHWLPNRENVSVPSISTVGLPSEAARLSAGFPSSSDWASDGEQKHISLILPGPQRLVGLLKNCSIRQWIEDVKGNKTSRSKQASRTNSSVSCWTAETSLWFCMIEVHRSAGRPRITPPVWCPACRPRCGPQRWGSSGSTGAWSHRLWVCSATEGCRCRSRTLEGRLCLEGD